MPDPFLPAAQRIEIIRAYTRQYKSKVFIETGTSTGDTTAGLLDEFEELNTIEIVPSIYAAAVKRFAAYPKVHCLLGDSGEVVPKLVHNLIIGNITAMFWLDGHFCGGEGRGPIDTPIRSELEAALRAPIGSVILIDDARLFGEMTHHTEEFKDYPTITWVQETAEAHGFASEVTDDIIRLVNRRI